MSKPAEMRVEYAPLSELKSAKRNPKLHDIDAIEASIRRFGLAAVVAVVNEKDGRMVAGHGRCSVLRAMKERGEKPPKRVEVDDDGGWLVPVLRGVSFRNGKEAEAYLLADNRLVEVGGWHRDGLAEMLRDLREHDALAGIGYAETDVDEILSRVEPRQVDPPKDFPEITGDVSTAYRCPKCSYEWNGLPK